MANLFDYLAWRGDLDFSEAPFNPVDNIIFSQMAYLTLDDIVPGLDENDGIGIDIAIRIYNEKLNSPEGIKRTSFFNDDPKLINAIAASRRFGNCYLFGYVNHVDTNREIQFAAFSVHINGYKKHDSNSIILFRGTDISVIGWKENFNMCFKSVVPSQVEAVSYLEKIAPRTNGPLRLCGHSEGGNLAIYAASFCNKNIQKRITDIFSNDAPGFHENVITSSGFKAIKDRIRSYVPQASVIGMFLEHEYENKVIKSSKTGLMQHDLYSWEVTYNDLVHINKPTIGSRYVNKTLREWIDKLNNTQREQFIEALYYILGSAKVKSIYEIEVSWFATASRLIKSYTNVDLQTRRLIRKIMIELFRSAGRNIDTLLNNKE